MAKSPNKEVILPQRQDFPPNAIFVIKEFDVPLLQLPDGRWINWFGGVPRPYDHSGLKPGNNWLADSFDEWIAIMAQGTAV